MSRNLSPQARSALYAPQTSDVFVVLLTLSHDNLPEPIRVSSDAVNTVSRGNTYIAYPFDLTLPDESEGRPPRARLVIDNIDRLIIGSLRQIQTAPKLCIEIVRSAAPDVIEAIFDDFRLANVIYDSQSVSCDLTIEDFTSEPYPSSTFCPSLFPGLF